MLCENTVTSKKKEQNYGTPVVPGMVLDIRETKKKINIISFVTSYIETQISR